MTQEENKAPVFEVMRASAGSGKTFSLVRRYLECCLGNSSDQYFRHILAITFTNKAADEMKLKVIEAVQEMVHAKGDHFADLVKALKMEPSALQEKAERVYEKMMTNYGQISILTIDKFVNRLVRSFTRELTLDGDFRLELDQERLIGAAVDEMLTKVGGEDPDLTRILESYALQRAENEENWKFRDDLIKFGKLLFKEETRPVLDHLQNYDPKQFTDLHASYQKEVLLFESKAKKAALKLIQLLDANGLSQSDFQRSNVYKTMLDFEATLKEPSETVQVILSGEDEKKKLYTAKFAKQEPEKAQLMDALFPQIQVLAGEVLAFFHGEYGKVIQLKRSLLKTLYPLAVLQQLNVCLEVVRGKQNSLTFSDLNHRLEMLVKAGPAPFIYERTGERYHHFFIDEFQDTSVVQWMNFLPLIDNSLASGFHNLVVGDGKQAIYRWRNGDVRQIQNLPKLLKADTPEMKEWAASLDRYYKPEFLEQNWRSKAEVVNFNNTLFTHLQSVLSEDHQSIYDRLSQEPKGGEGGWVTVKAINPPPKGVDDRLLERHEAIKALIEENVESKFELKDIAILVRNRKDGSALARYLIDQRIPTITDESLQLGKHVSSLSVVYLMKSLFQPEDQTSKVQFIQTLSAYREEFEQGRIFAEYTEIPDKGRSHFDLERFLKEELRWENLDTLLGLDLFALMEKIMEYLKVADVFPAYAEALLDLALQYQIDDSGGLSGFLEWWDDEAHRKSIQIPEHSNGVKVLTIHKSKGLEFPVVISLVTNPSRGGGGGDLYPVDLDPGIFGIPTGLCTLGGMKNTWAHDQFERERSAELLDEMNVYYVAFTRAKCHLNVLFETSAKPSNEEAIAYRIYAGVSSTFGVNDMHTNRATFGTRMTVSDSEKPKGKTTVLEKLSYADPAKRLKVSVDDPKLRAEGDTLSPRAEGEELHNILATVKDGVELNALEQMQTPWQRMAHHEWTNLKHAAKRIIENPDTAHWFKECDEVLNERELMDENGSTLRPDRVFRKGDEWWVVDYKTGNKENSHKKQLESYRQELKKLTNSEVHARILYTDSLEVVEV